MKTYDEILSMIDASIASLLEIKASLQPVEQNVAAGQVAIEIPEGQILPCVTAEQIRTWNAQRPSADIVINGQSCNHWDPQIAQQNIEAATENTNRGYGDDLEDCDGILYGDN